MSSMIGQNIKVQIFGQSHSQGLGVVIDGIPAGEKIDLERIHEFLARRQGGKSFSTPRKESDTPRIVSGLIDGVTCGAPLCALFENANTRSGDYEYMKQTPRPGHADFTANVKHSGHNDFSGGGHFSGRLTLPLCFAGAVCLQLLEKQDIHIGAHISSIGALKDTSFDATTLKKDDFCGLESDFPLLDKSAEKGMKELIENAREEHDSIGGVIECGVTGLPVGWGDPLFDTIESRLAYTLFAIPAVKGVEFGEGFAVAKLKGSESNDAFYYANDLDGNKVVKTRTNNCGGILGGITNGMPLVFRAAFKPTPSIGTKQDTVNITSGETVELSIKGRHDPCIVPRAVPAVISAAAITLYDIARNK